MRRGEQQGCIPMDKDRTVGSIKEGNGAAKTAVGNAVGDAKLQSDGKIVSAVGKVQNAAASAKDAIRGAGRHKLHK